MTGQLFGLPPGEEVRLKTEAQGSKDFVDQVMYWMTAPYLTWPGHEDIWQVGDNHNTALIRRLAEQKEIWETKQCSEFEAMIYISTFTLNHAPDHHLAQVYFYLFRRWCGAEQADKLDIRGPETLDPTEKELLSDVRSWIFRQQLHRLKARGLGETVEVKKEAKQLQDQQAKLF